MMRVAVVGGGVAGLSAAARLAPHAQVTVYEAEPHVGYHASGRSAAMFEENYGNDAVRALNRASKSWFEATGVLSPRGLLMVALEAEIPLFETDLADMGLTEVSLAAARDRIPILSDDILRAAVHDGAQDIDTGRVLDLFSREVTTHGGAIRRNAEVISLERTEVWKIGLLGETVEADVVVNAGGAWADQVAGLAEIGGVGLQPYRRSMARLPSPGGRDVRDWPMLFGPGENWYAKPDAGAWIVSPADEDPSAPMDAWADDMVLAEGLARYEAHVCEPVTHVIANWAGLRTFAPDRTLVIGAEPDADGFFWMAGQGGYGFQTAPAASRLLADLVLGKTPELSPGVVSALSPARFRRKGSDAGSPAQAKSGV